MPSVNQPNPKIDQTVKVFDDFYNFAIEVDSNTYDVVNAYFSSVFKNQQAAESFTISLFRIAEESQVPVLTILAQIQDQDQIELTATIAYYLNGLRSPATLLGINSAVVPNQWAARNVLP
jgi:pyruvate/2-oxoacid:ferredoxin oxidoreductase alpha subunit